MTNKSSFSTIKIKTIVQGTTWEDREPDLYRLFVKAVTDYNSSNSGKSPRKFLHEKFPKLKNELGEKYELFVMEFEQYSKKEPGETADMKMLEKAVRFNDTANILSFLSDFRDNSTSEQ